MAQRLLPCSVCSKKIFTLHYDTPIQFPLLCKFNVHELIIDPTQKLLPGDFFVYKNESAYEIGRISKTVTQTPQLFIIGKIIRYSFTPILHCQSKQKKVS